MKHLKATLITASICAAALGMPGTAGAAPITFGGLSGANGDPFSTYTENGFTVATTQGTWVEAHLFGAPVPDIFSTSSVAAVSVTGPGLFSFSDVDLGLAGGTDVSYSITGMLGAATLYSFAGSLTGVSFHNVLNSSSLLIDKLLITMTKAGASSYNIDNINVTAVPEPSSYLLMALGLAGLAAMRSKKRGS